MYRNQYDSDVTTFAPTGKLHQVEYAMNAVNQGSACCGLRSKNAVVLVANKEGGQADDLSEHTEKIFAIDKHIGIVVAGLVADARYLSKWMINECLNHSWAFETPINSGRLVTALADKSQVYTQKSEKRPYGVGLLVAGIDKTGPHLYQTDPSGDFFEFEANAMGNRSQSARTYLEKNFEAFPDCSVDELIKHGMLAIKSTAQDPLSTRNVSIGVVTKDNAFRLLSEEELRPHIEAVKDEEVEAAEDEKKEDEKEE
mmetsp:Transcript_18978/g.26624  ORF Transcript_18978/g.26624 Transcript_18978/m.26624 type:complete len:256 (-) Transcript_18978:46-813(-)